MTYGPMVVGMGCHNAFWADGDDMQYYYVPEGFVRKYGSRAGLRANHDVTLIGWDDSVKKEYFTLNLTAFGEDLSYTPPGDGAWIIRNSCGTDRHDEGDFYMSYYDYFISTDVDHAAFGQIESGSNYNHAEA